MELIVQGLRINMLQEHDFVVAEVPNGWEKATMRIWCEHLRRDPPDHFAMDIGAYTGIYSLLAQAMHVSVLAFEPHPKVYERLKVNGVVRTFSTALSNRSTIGTLLISNDVALPSGSGLNPHEVRPTERRVKVVVHQGDFFLLKTRPISIIKIDVEGHEIEVLQGLTKTIREFRPTLIVECLTHNKLMVICGFMAALNYQAQRINDVDDCLDNDMSPQLGKTNFLFKFVG